MFQDIDSQVKDILAGDVLMLVCLLFYLLWWCIVFKPGSRSGIFSTICIMLAFITGIASVVMGIKGISSVTGAPASVSIWKIVVGGVLAYLVLLAISSLIFHRQVTSELLIIVGWSILELAIIDTLWSNGALGGAVSLAFVIIIVVVAIGSLVCYLLYYRLPPMASYIDGMIPLIAGCLLMVGMMVAILVSRS